jgi:hypothetical protein
MTGHSAAHAPLIVLGMASLFILSVTGTFGALEFRSQLLAAARWARKTAARLPLFRPHHGGHRDPARPVVGASARRTPPRVESAAAAGTGPGRAAPGSAPSLPGTARHDITRQPRQPWHTAPLPAMPAPPPQHAYDPGDGLFLVPLARPYAPAPVYGEACQLDVREAERLAAVMLP